MNWERWIRLKTFSLWKGWYSAYSASGAIQFKVLKDFPFSAQKISTRISLVLLSKINTFFPLVRSTILNGHYELQKNVPGFWKSNELPGHRKCLENLHRTPLSSAPVENLGQTMLISRNFANLPTLDKRKYVLKWISNLASVHKVGDSS